MKTQITTSNKPIAYVPKSDKKPSWKRFLLLVKISIFLTLLASLGVNYTLIRKHYVFRCAEGGMFMSQVTCDKFANKEMDNLEVHRLEMIANNPDLFEETTDADNSDLLN